MLDKYILDLQIFTPEILLGILFLVLIVLGLIIKKHKTEILGFVFIFGILATLYIVSKQITLPNSIFLFSKMICLTSFAVQIKILILVSAIAIAIHSLIKKSIKDYELEFYVLITGTILAGNILVMANNWLVVFVCLETVSIASYALVALRWKQESAQASVRYILFGLVCSAVMLYGISLFYGLNGSLFFDEVKTLPVNLPALPTIIAFLFISVGIFFKLSLFPFHFWVADVYEGTPPLIVSFLSVVIKIIAIGLLISIYSGYQPSYLPIVPPVGKYSLFLSILAIITITIGNLGAYFQQNTMRLLAFSSIAHVGFMFLPLAFGNGGFSTVYMYLIIYGIMNFAVFFLVDGTILANKITAFSGLGKQKPVLAIGITLLFVSLAGLPPMAGFMAKFFIFSSLWQVYGFSENPVYVFIFIVLIINTVIGIFYYIKIPYYMYFKEKNDDNFEFSKIETAYFLVLILGLIILFFVPSLVI